MRQSSVWISAAAIGILAITGCQRPLGDRAPGRRVLREMVQAAITRELEAVPTSETQTDATEHDDVMASLADRREELDALGPADALLLPLQLGPDLADGEQERVELSLAAAIESAISRNLGIQISQLQPLITAEDVISAQAIFDAVLFANVNAQWVDQPQRVPVLGGIPLGTPFNRFENQRYETGLRKRFSPGTEAFVSTDVNRLRNRTPGITFSPDPAYTAAVRIGATQPLLRGFGDEVNTASIRLAQNLQRRTSQQLDADLLQLRADVERTYWNLHAAWQELAIAQWLVDEGVAVRTIMERRQDFDARPAQFSDAVARVEQRQADVIRARRGIRAASDALKALINDPHLTGGTIASETVVRPLDQPAESPLAFDLRETILGAVGRRPELKQAALQMDDALIRQRVADNERLPLLNLSAEAAFFGLDDHIGGAYRQADSGNFIDYILGIAFEWPLGGRAADAGARAARLQRSAAALNYERLLQAVILDVKNALRDVVANYELIRATRSFRIAQAENLRTLLIEEELLAGLTPEFLNLKFTRQDTLAQARRQEVQALVDFNQSLAALRRAIGEHHPGGWVNSTN